MSITFPTFIDKEIVAPEKLNSFVQALEAKFAAGLSSAEIVWPLSAGGDLQMGDENITGGRSIWGIYNADQYDDDWDSCLSDAGSDGGCIVIPPDTTVVMDGSTMGGSSLTIRGSGPTSILQLESGATGGWALKNSGSNFSFNLSNLTVDGQDIADNCGIQLEGAAEVIINKVRFKDFALSAIKLVSKGSDPCRSVRITDNHFEGGASYHIEGSAVRDVVISDNVFETAAKTAINLVAASATALIKRVEIGDNTFKGCTNEIIDIQGGAGAFNVYQGHIKVHGNIADNLNGIKVGDASHRLQYVDVTDNIVPSSYDNGLMVCAQYGSIKGNVMPGATDDGLDLLESKYIVASGNSFRGAGEAGVRATDSEDCNITDNDCVVTGAATGVVQSNSVTNPSHSYSNGDIPESAPLNIYFTDNRTLTLPAGTIKVGDVVEVYAQMDDDSAGIQGTSFGGQICAGFIGTNSGSRTMHHARIIVTSATAFTSYFETFSVKSTHDTVMSVYEDQSPIDLESALVVQCSDNAGAASCRLTVFLHRGVVI